MNRKVKLRFLLMTLFGNWLLSFSLHCFTIHHAQSCFLNDVVNIQNIRYLITQFIAYSVSSLICDRISEMLLNIALRLLLYVLYVSNGYSYCWLKSSCSKFDYIKKVDVKKYINMPVFIYTLFTYLNYYFLLQVSRQFHYIPN